MHDDDKWSRVPISSTSKEVVTIFTRYPDLEAKSVREGLGIDVVSELRKIINDDK